MVHVKTKLNPLTTLEGLREKFRRFLKLFLRSFLQKKPAAVSSLLYGMLEDQALVETAFEKMRVHLWEELDQARESSPRKILFYEFGRIAPDLRYLYIKPVDSSGWLFEEALGGWIVSRCEKNTNSDTFMRKGAPWDRVLLYCKNIADGRNNKEPQLRIFSSTQGHDLIGMHYYLRWLTKAVMHGK